MKVVSIAILRTGPDVAEPIPVSMACELSSYGFFQRQVRTCNYKKLQFWGLAIFFFSEEFLWPISCVLEQRVVVEGTIRMRGNMRHYALLGLGRPAWYACSAERISPGILLFSANFWLSVRALSDLLGRSVREECPQPKLASRQRTRPIISVPVRVRNVSCAAESDLSKRRGLTEQAILCRNK